MKKLIFTLSLSLLSFYVALKAQDCVIDNPPILTTYTFTSSCNFIVPTGYTLNITVEAWGGGGGGGAGSGRKGGGGGGAYATKTFTVTAGSYAITVGTGGGPGNAGGNSSFATEVIAVGGQSGSGNNGFQGGQAAACTPTVGAQSGGNGGNASDDCNFFGDRPDGGGGGGGSAFSTVVGGSGGNGTCFIIGIGGGGGDGEGDGGNGGSNGGAGTSATQVGGGGGGKGGGTTSGSGFRGQVRVTVNSPILPIELLSFTGRQIDNSIHLSWSTATEQNNDYMAVERSADGRTFQELGRVKGAGTTLEPQEYSFIDEKPLRGLNYYRLRQVDFDGAVEYHKVISVEFNGKGSAIGVSAFPNPANEMLYTSWLGSSEQPTTLRVLDMMGRQVAQYQLPAGTSNFELPLDRLQAGLYMLEVQQGVEVEVVRFRKG